MLLASLFVADYGKFKTLKQGNLMNECLNF